MVGSMLQLPRWRRLADATIAALSSVFDVPPELAASCGILLWLVTFAAVVPLAWPWRTRETVAAKVVGGKSSAEEGEIGGPPA